MICDMQNQAYQSISPTAKLLSISLALTLLLMPGSVIISSKASANNPPPSKHLSTNATNPPVATAPATTVKTLTAAAVIKIVRATNIYRKEYPLQAFVDDTRVKIFTVLRPNSSEHFSKFDAVLIAKALFDHSSGHIANVETILVDSQTAAVSQLSVSLDDVQAYADGRIGKGELFDLIKLSDLTSAEMSSHNYSKGNWPVFAGPFGTARHLLAERIKMLDSQGIDTKPFQQIFKQILARASKASSNTELSELKNEISILSENLNQQEEALIYAHDRNKGSVGRLADLDYFHNRFQRDTGTTRSGLDQRLYKLVKNKITELENQGLDESADRAELQRIIDLDMHHDLFFTRLSLFKLAQRLGVSQ